MARANVRQHRVYSGPFFLLLGPSNPNLKLQALTARLQTLTFKLQTPNLKLQTLTLKLQNLTKREHKAAKRTEIQNH